MTWKTTEDVFLTEKVCGCERNNSNGNRKKKIIWICWLKKGKAFVETSKAKVNKRSLLFAPASAINRKSFFGLTGRFVAIKGWNKRRRKRRTKELCNEMNIYCVRHGSRLEKLPTDGCVYDDWANIEKPFFSPSRKRSKHVFLNFFHFKSRFKKVVLP